jgi:hypothetical protein
MSAPVRHTGVGSRRGVIRFGHIDRRFVPTPALLWNYWRAHEYLILGRVNRKASLFLPVVLKD